MIDQKPQLTGQLLCEIFEAVLPENHLRGIIKKARFQERTRKRDAVAFLRAMVIAAGTGYGGRQRDVARMYFDSGATPVVRGGFYQWFGPELETAMEAVVCSAMAYAASLPLDLPPLMARFARDFHIFDSTTVKLPLRLIDEYPGAGKYAALKVHKRLSVGLGTVVAYSLSPAREHDSLHLEIDESWRGLGVLMDLGYASVARLLKCDEHGVVYVIRLKDNWKPRVQHIHRGEVTATFCAGSDLDVLLRDGTLLVDGRVIDAAVTVGPVGREAHCRLVGVPGPDGEYHLYLTNLPRAAGPKQVADIYRVRWEIEADNKLDKSCNHLDEITARTGPAARALVHASLVSSMLACLIVHRHRLSQHRPPASGTERKFAPLHPQSLARAMAATAQRIADTLDLPAAAAAPVWQKIADYLVHLGTDPNWRSRPSVLDQMRGWSTSPGRPRRARVAESSRPRAK
jgi:putative transposase